MRYSIVILKKKSAKVILWKKWNILCRSFTFEKFVVIEQDLDQAQKGAAMQQELIWKNITFHVPFFLESRDFQF